MRRSIVPWVTLASLLLAGPPLAAQRGPAPASPAVAGRVVNGLPVAGYPSVGQILLLDQGPATCTGTLIGCGTVLTAAHCVCTDPKAGLLTGAQCGERADLLDPATKLVYFHHAGAFSVASILVHPAFVFGQASDLAVIRLGAPVTGVAPSSIDTTAKPGPGAAGVIVGFGLTEDPASAAGIKQAGDVVVAACGAAGIDAASHVCADLSAPLGAPGTDSGPCHGDSGGPLFVDLGAGPAIAGTVSGGDSRSFNCAPPEHLWFADVFRDRAWIQGAAGADLGTGACGGLPAAGGPDAPSAVAVGTLSPAHTSDTLPIAVPAGVARLRVGLTAENIVGTHAALYLRRGSPPTAASFACKSTDGTGILAFCEVAAPAAGTWYALVDGGSGANGGAAGRYEVVTTLFSRPAAVPCAPSATTLCIDDQPGDRRFQIEVAFHTAQGGGASGPGHAVPLASLGVASGGLFWFFDPANPEMLIKVLNGCALGGHYWVFSAAGTNVGLTTTVTDTQTGAAKTYTNPDRTPAPPILDTSALPCG